MAVSMGLFAGAITETTACPDAALATARHHPAASHAPAVLCRIESVPVLGLIRCFLRLVGRSSIWSAVADQLKEHFACRDASAQNRQN
jgi:hypothetical protein